MNIDINNVNKIEKRHKVCTKLWRIIYKVKQQALFYETDIFPGGFIKYSKYNANEARNIKIVGKII